MVKKESENTEKQQGSEDSVRAAEQDIGKIRREVGNRTTRRIMEKLRNQDYGYSISKDLMISQQTFRYHLQEKLLPKNLARETGKEDGKTYYKLTPKGEKVLEGLNELD